MLKKMVLMLVVLGLVLGFSSPLALAQEKAEFPELRLVYVREEPVNVPRYVEAQVDFWAEVVARLLKTGKPNVVFNKTEAFGFEVTVVEGVLWDKIDVVTGFTMKNEERGKFLVGVELNMGEGASGIWKIFQRFRPAVYLAEGDICWGFSYEFRVLE